MRGSTIQHLLRLVTPVLRAQARDALEASNWFRYICTIDRAYHWRAFRLLKPTLSDAEYWQCLRDVWMDSETLWQQRRWLRPTLFPKNRSGREGLMTDIERARLMALPEAVTVYRGGERRNLFTGWSYTLDPERAQLFALRFSTAELQFPRPEGFVLEARVERSEIAALFLEREENEVVCDPRDVSRLKTYHVKETTTGADWTLADVK